MEKDIEVRLNSLEKRLKECEEPGTLMYCRPGSDNHETLVNFLNDVYIEMQQIKQQINAITSNTSNN